MSNHTEVLNKCREAIAMGFWEYAVAQLLEDGWGIEFFPVGEKYQDSLGKFNVRVRHITDEFADGVPIFGDSYNNDFARALDGALERIQSGYYDPTKS